MLLVASLRDRAAISKILYKYTAHQIVMTILVARVAKMHDPAARTRRASIIQAFIGREVVPQTHVVFNNNSKDPRQRYIRKLVNMLSSVAIQSS